jgi:uncharacterized BrkB/YihY/UPF0761 family membrane protein
MVEESGQPDRAVMLPARTAAKAPVPARTTAQSLAEWIRRFEKSAAGRYWEHLSTADFMNRSFAFAALSVLSAFPFLAVSSSVLGGDFRTAIVARMGLSDQAKSDIDGLIGTGNQAVATLTWFSAVILVLGGIGMASTLSAWYHRIYERTPQYRQVPLRRMFPAGVATGACLTGLGVVSAFFFSDQVTSGQRSYGPAGVVIALITFLVGYGVCLHAGAVFGRMWNDWQDERASLSRP